MSLRAFHFSLFTFHYSLFWEVKNMKKLVLIVGLLTMALMCVVQEARAQGKPALGPDPSTLRDADIEKDSLHNLDVARQYFKLKKAYVASLQRCEAVIAGYSNFAM